MFGFAKLFLKGVMLYTNDVMASRDFFLCKKCSITSSRTDSGKYWSGPEMFAWL